LVALFCTLSKIFISFFKYGIHACMQYSNLGLINDLCNCNINFLLLHRKVHLIIPNTALVIRCQKILTKPVKNSMLKQL